ncbi:MAG: hypothetical protein LIP23_10365 [Planctomycetes bacterium]|nr:hypothetical protein [Planctomycetota bacterium]
MSIPFGDTCDGCGRLERRDDAETWWWCSKYKCEVREWKTRFGDSHILACKNCRDDNARNAAKT